MRRLVFATILALAPVAGAVAQQAPAAPPRWDQRLYNPAPAEGDLVLPMPCGGAIAFREVTVPASANPLDDRAVTIGSPIGIHYEQGLKALQAGKHIHFNKTMTTTTEEATAALHEEAAKAFPDAEIEVIEGAQPHYQYLISVE